MLKDLSTIRHYGHDILCGIDKKMAKLIYAIIHSSSHSIPGFRINAQDMLQINEISEEIYRFRSYRGQMGSDYWYLAISVLLSWFRQVIPTKKFVKMPNDSMGDYTKRIIDAFMAVRLIEYDEDDEQDEYPEEEIDFEDGSDYIEGVTNGLLDYPYYCPDDYTNVGGSMRLLGEWFVRCQNLPADGHYESSQFPKNQVLIKNDG
jgi:hypothetical protein